VTGKAILPNGASSAGKTTPAKSIQKRAAGTWLHTSLDDFIQMLPDGAELHDDWFPVISSKSKNGVGSTIRVGPRGHMLLSARREFAGTLLSRGLPVIVDDNSDGAGFEDYRRQIPPDALLSVEVVAPIEVLEQRERERGHRLIGLASEQAARIHQGMDYQDVIDTSKLTPDKAADEILRLL